MFLARTWTTRNGVRYETWVLKKAVWDKEKKRARQVYLASLGRSRRISLEKALAICGKLGISLDELRRVKRLKIAAPAGAEPARKAKLKEHPVAQPARPETLQEISEPLKPEPKEAAPKLPLKTSQELAALVGELRQRYHQAATLEGYQNLAMRIGVLRVSARELQNAEQGHGGLSQDQVELIEHLLGSQRHP